MLVVNVKRVGSRLHSCCRMMLISIFVLSKYDPDLYNDKKFSFCKIDADVESNIFWFVNVCMTPVATLVQICEIIVNY